MIKFVNSHPEEGEHYPFYNTIFNEKKVEIDRKQIRNVNVFAAHYKVLFLSKWEKVAFFIHSNCSNQIFTDIECNRDYSTMEIKGIVNYKNYNRNRLIALNEQFIKLNNDEGLFKHESLYDRQIKSCHKYGHSYVWLRCYGCGYDVKVYYCCGIINNHYDIETKIHQY